VEDEPSDQEPVPPQDIVDAPQETVVPELPSVEERVEEEIVAPVDDIAEPEPAADEETVESLPNQECMSIRFIVANHM
jgi:hypothetical protein